MDWFQQLPQNLLLGLEQGSLYALVALGYTLVYGVLQLINFAHSEVFMSGAFGSYLVIGAILGNRHLTGIMIPVVLLAGLIAGAVTGAAIAWLLEKVAYKTLRKRGAPKLAFLISAIGASFFLSNLAGKLFTRIPNNAIPGTVGGQPTYFNLDHNLINTTYFKLSVAALAIIVVAFLMMIGLDRLVNRTKLGRGIRAVAEDAPTAALMGIDIDRTISRTFVIGGALAGVAGFMYGIAFGGVFYTMGFTPGVKAFTAAVLGGIGNIRGAMLGGLLLGEAEVLISALPFIGATWVDVISFVVLILV
ncbi:MAG: branched-chain amino acid ABC transporter permease, partial [Actinobacteria bacterium]|nr:branched-chain amino acid ABC transporter permease [Actinomycetota bacterium]